MKKVKNSLKFISATVLATALSCGAFGIAGCASTQKVVGEVSYTEWGTNYGIKVQVEVKSSSKGDRIKEVTVLDSDYVSATEWEGRESWDNNLQNLLNAYRGEYVKDILAKEVATNEIGAPIASDEEGFKNYGEEFIITGATLGSGRLMLAVQNALKQINA